MRKLFLAALALAACDGGGRDSAGDLQSAACGASTTSPGGTLNPQAWIIGPGNISVGMPRHPSPHAEGWAFDFPHPDRATGNVHYVTFNHGPLSGKSRIRMRYRIEAAEGVRFLNDRGGNAAVTLYFQRRGDEWRGERTEAYRWWASFDSRPLSAGEHEIVAPLDSLWTAVMTSTRDTNPQGYAGAIAGTECAGFTFGGFDAGGTGLGHGAHATGPARFVLLEFRVE